jgi:hypothetical protein
VETLALIDRLEALLRDARPVPLTDQVRVDKREISELLQEMRTAFAEDVRRGRQGDSATASSEDLVAEVTAAVESVLRENIPAIAQAAAAAARGGGPPPGGPF